MKMEIVPFGKYKGQSSDVLLHDEQYLSWCKSQDSLVAKYPWLKTLGESRKSNEKPDKLKLLEDENKKLKEENFLLLGRIKMLEDEIRGHYQDFEEEE